MIIITKAFVLHSFVLGVDIGGSHITGALFNYRTTRLLTETHCRKEVDALGAADAIIRQWCDAIRQSWQLGGVLQSRIGIAVPGPFDYQNGICLIRQQDKYRSLYGLNIRQILAEELKITVDEIQFINDACGFLQGEVFAGSVKGLPDVFGITLGTGLGSAVYSGGQVVDADMWRMPYRSSIAEDYLSTRWFVKEYKLRTGKDISGVKELAELDSNNIVDSIFTEFGKNLGCFIENACETHGATAIVIGGNIVNAHSKFLKTVQDHLDACCPGIKIFISQLGEKAVLAGAAAIFRESNISKSS